MDVELRQLKRTDRPSAGEVWIRSSTEDRRDLATLALERGVSGLACGEPPWVSVVVNADPTLDDMLAMELVQDLQAGRSPPSGMVQFARYAALAREGLHPGSVSLELSLEGVYLAIRNQAPGPLLEPGAGHAFLQGWRRLRDRVWQAAAEGLDPFSLPVVSAAQGFGRELAYLAGDREVFRQDVARGERWLLRLPDGPQQSTGLLLRQPRSLLFKNWSRSDPDAPGGSGTNLLLAVWRSPGQWVFSTDPVQRLSLLGLHQKLQAAEAQVSPSTAATDPWFDGAPWQHTLVAAPHGGSRLTDARVMAIARDWSGARVLPQHQPRPRRRALLSAGLVTALCGGLALASSLPAGPGSASERVSRGSGLSRERRERLRTEGLAVPKFALLVAVGEAQEPRSRFGPLAATRPDAGRLYTLLRDRYGYQPEHVWLLADGPVALEGTAPVHTGPATRDGLLDAIRDLGAATDQYDHSTLLFYYAGHGDVEHSAVDIGHLVLSGYRQDDPLRTGFQMNHLSRDLMERVRSSHQLLLLDCCYSGLALQRGTIPDAGRVYELWKNRAYVVITAASEREPAWEEQLGGSLFTNALLLGLGEGLPADLQVDGGRDGIITDEELMHYLGETVKDQTPQRAPYRPQQSDVGQFLFLPVSNASGN